MPSSSARSRFHTIKSVCSWISLRRIPMKALRFLAPAAGFASFGGGNHRVRRRRHIMSARRGTRRWNPSSSTNSSSARPTPKKTGFSAGFIRSSQTNRWRSLRCSVCWSCSVSRITKFAAAKRQKSLSASTTRRNCSGLPPGNMQTLSCRIFTAGMRTARRCSAHFSPTK